MTEPDNQVIREQLGKLLASPFFCHSQRLPQFLRAVIELTLAGDLDSIKERTLGVEIFGRDAHYETATDPIVRVTAAEVRKRVAQYYQEPGHQDELRIILPSGSYIPQFHWPNGVHDIVSQTNLNRPHMQYGETPSLQAEETAPLIAARNESDAPNLELPSKPSRPEVHFEAHNPHALRHFGLIAGIACITVGLLSVGTVMLWHAIYRSPLDFFWGPVLSASDPVLICAGDQLQDTGINLRDTTDPSHFRWFEDPSKKNAFLTVALDHVSVIVKLAAILQSKHKQYVLKGERTTNLEDLRSGPGIFVGAFDNAWTLRLSNSLHFRFANDPGVLFPRIVDSTAPTKPGWAIDGSQMASTGHYTDYAIVARFIDSNTGKLAVVAAGIGRCGSLAAGQFLSDPDDLANLERAARAAGNKKNMELVLSTQVIDGQPGSPKVEGAYFW